VRAAAVTAVLLLLCVTVRRRHDMIGDMGGYAFVPPCLSSRYGRMGDDAAAQHLADTATASGTVVKGLCGNTLRGAQCGLMPRTAVFCTAPV
jgi:hypothetical protein